AEAADLRYFRLPPSYADLIVSSYALHHLTHAEKYELTRRMAQGLRPGGRLVIADMMFGRGGSQRGHLLAEDLAVPKNLVRYGLGIGTERPAKPEFWQQALYDAGLAEI